MNITENYCLKFKSVCPVELGYKSNLSDKICYESKRTSCNAVINSGGVLYFKYFKISDLSVIYFSSLIISWIIHVFLNEEYSSMLAFTLLAVLITPYTLYYQYRIAKKWCVLCLGVTSVLWLQLSSIFFVDFTALNLYNLRSLSIIFLTLLPTISIWLSIKPLLKKQQELKKLKIQYYKFKRNFELFFAIYSKSSLVVTTNIRNKEIILGSENAKLKILLVTNPACFYCKSAHTDLTKLLERHNQQINITLRFNVSKDMNTLTHKTANRLLQIYHEDNFNIIKALEEVFKENVNLDEWLQKWNMPVSKYSYDDILIDQKEWCRKNDIHFTPALYINGKEYPKYYDRNDLQYFIEDLIEKINCLEEVVTS